MAAAKRCSHVTAKDSPVHTCISSHGILDWGKDWTSKPQGLGPMICFHINGKLQVPAATNMKPEEGFWQQNCRPNYQQCSMWNPGTEPRAGFPPGQLWSERLERLGCRQNICQFSWVLSRIIYVLKPNLS